MPRLILARTVIAATALLCSVPAAAMACSHGQPSPTAGTYHCHFHHHCGGTPTTPTTTPTTPTTPPSTGGSS